MTIENLYSIFLSYHQKICTDTRKIIPDSIFFALKGKNFDGNNFAIKAIENGCAYAIVDNIDLAQQHPRCILVENVLKTLQDLAHYHRQQLNTTILAIAGSNGKTTTKELITAVLSQKYKTHSTPGNLNNHIGTPLTLLQMTKEHQIGIIELGANHPGEIQELCDIVQPDFGIITSIGKEHLEGFGNIENVMKTNGELYNYLLRHNGKIIIQLDNKDLMNTLALYKVEPLHILQHQEQFILYCTKQFFKEHVDFYKSIENIVLGEYIDTPSDIFVQFNWQLYSKKSGYSDKHFIKTQLLAQHNFINALSAVAIGNYFGVNPEQINTDMAHYLPDKNRMQLIRTSKNLVILDAYNANPTSMLAALEFFKEKTTCKEKNVLYTPPQSIEPTNAFTSHEKVLILGDMFELGEHSEKEHTAIVQWIANNFREGKVFLIGKAFGNALKKYPIPSNCQHVETTELFIDQLHHKQIVLSGNLILIKASRGMQLEKIKPYL